VGIAIEVRGEGSERLRLQVLNDASAEALDTFIKTAVAPRAIVHTDGWRGYDHVAALGYVHDRRSQRAMPSVQLLPRAHRAISNLKAWVGLRYPPQRRRANVQVYLDEYVFRHNRRRTPMAAFQTLLGRGAQHPQAPTTTRSTGRD